MKNVRTIAFYLPQYYPTSENDIWWGKGFTEWTNVRRAKPLFKGHYQPKIPADLGYYDLRNPEVRIQQAQMAKNAGIEGFCYWHYWFAGRRLLDRVFREVIESGSPNYPFCLCWANHSWYAKTWDPQIPDKLLIEQTYPGREDYEEHFYAMLPAFKDSRYIKVDGKLLFGVYAPMDIPNTELFISKWNQLAKENGLNGFYFVGFTFDKKEIDPILQKGFDSVTIDYIKEAYKSLPLLENIFLRLRRKFFRIPIRLSYRRYMDCLLENYSVQANVHPCILPNFDHSPRSAYRGCILTGSTPKEWGKLCKQIFCRVNGRTNQRNLVFVKAWNEWGEGNYLEPDLRYGLGYLDELKKVIAL